MSLEMLGSARTASSLPVIVAQPHQPFRHPADLRIKQVPDYGFPALGESTTWRQPTSWQSSAHESTSMLPKIDVAMCVSPDVSTDEVLSRQVTLMHNLDQLREKRTEFFGSLHRANQRVTPAVYLRDDQRMRALRLDGARSAARQTFGVHDYLR